MRAICSLASKNTIAEDLKEQNKLKEMSQKPALYHLTSC